MECLNNKYETLNKEDFDTLCSKVRKELDKKGLAEIKDFFSDEYVGKMKNEANRYFENNKNTFSLTKEKLKDSIFYDFAFSDFVYQMSQGILKNFGLKIEEDDILPVLGKSIPPEYKDKTYHFDSVYLTIAVPIIMPDKDREDCGRFEIWPNIRRFSGNQITNKFYWHIMKAPFIRNFFNKLEINFNPGSIYFFYGFRSWHGVGKLGPDLIRINNLIHIKNVLK
jgi:hypothetical protein